MPKEYRALNASDARSEHGRAWLPFRANRAQRLERPGGGSLSEAGVRVAGVHPDGTAAAADLDAVEAGILERVEDAVAYAEAGEPADPELAETLMFAPEGES